jgi:UrcA family protein
MLFLKNGERGAVGPVIHGSSIEGENHMDTTLASPKRASPKAPSILAAALSVGVGIWLVAMTTEMAMAQTPAAPHTAVVYSDLDLTTADGAGALLKRINVAAMRICGPGPTHSPLMPREAAHYHNCVADSVDAAVARVGSPLLASLHNNTQSSISASLAAR